MKLVLAMAAVLVAMLAATAGPAMADHNNRHHGDRWEDRQGDCDWFNCHRGDHHRGDHNDLDFDESFFLFPLFAVEEIDIDCDGEDDDWDGWIDEGADCEVEIEFFDWWD
jgi:hypothetical protein